MDFDVSNLKISRRVLLQGAAAGALVGALPMRSLPARAQAYTPVELSVELAEVDQPGGNPGPLLRTYNRKSPGPTLEVWPGQALEVQVTNTLDPQPADELCPADMNQYHAANTTNLHTHGLHVSPEKSADGNYDSDNVFLSIVPDGQDVPDECDSDQVRRGSAQFRFELPDDHPSGTFWYHAHKHGSTAQQVANGLVGPLIVRDKPGLMPRYIENAKEDILMIQMRDIVKDTPAPGDKENGGTKHLVLVDPSGDGGGQVDPTIVLRPGEVRRWRIINAAPRADGFVSLNIQNLDGGEAFEVYQIAYDGITYDKRIPINTSDTRPPWENPASLAPGNRTDFMIRVPRDSAQGEFGLVALQLPNAVLHASADSTEEEKNSMTLKIRIEGDPVDDEWPEDDSLPGPGPLLAPIAPDEIVGDRYVNFQLLFGEGITPTRFMIDGAPFDGKVKQRMQLGTAERWGITNDNTFTHPFHIHVNPFFVTHVNGERLPDGHPLRRWQDTIAIPPTVEGAGHKGSITMETRYVRFPGKFVIHCHILEHEDQGMMQAVEVVV